MSLKEQRVDAKNAEIIRRSDYLNTLNAIIAEGFCPFCEEHLFKHHRRPIIFRNKHWLVTENSWPYKGSRYHFLFIVRTHIEKSESMSPPMWADFHKLYRKIVRRYKLSGATLMMRSGDMKLTGATVGHLHAQLIVGISRTKKTKPIKALVAFKK